MSACSIIGKYILVKMDARILTNLTSNIKVVEKKPQFQCRRSSVSGRQRRATRSMAKGTYRRGIPRHRRNRPQSNCPQSNDECNSELLRPVLYVAFTELYYSLEERLLYFLQSTECPQKHGGF